MSYNPKKIEKKWQEEWERQGFNRAENFSRKAKQYILVEFPYPSGEGLHVGHTRSYSALDALARKKRMEGYNVLYPIGWDAFGLPTENYAIKTGIHPRQATDKNIKNYKRQLKSLGLSFDWSREIDTTNPKYYKWTQWIFLKFFENGLAYQAEMPINWCPSCKIGLANEEAVGGVCERCGTQTEKKQLKQWLLKITAYADRLIDDLEKVDYLEKIKIQQINWIGRSEGTDADFKIKETDKTITVFTTRIDTIFGVTALVLAPENPLIKDLEFRIQNSGEVKKYIDNALKRNEIERTSEEKERTGVELQGIKAVNPINNEEIPVWIADYVIPTYGGGAVMMVPAHDKRDWDFAKNHGLEIKCVILPLGRSIQFFTPADKIREIEIKNIETEEAFLDYGRLIRSGEFNELKSEEAIKKIAGWLEKKKLGRKTVNYKLRDWIFSRQHYWGEPIPLIFCENCKKLAENAECRIKNSEFNKGELLNPGWIVVPKKDLPVELPYVKKYQPTGTGESPLAAIKSWVNVKCPKCGGPAKRETDTMPNWAGSSWYYLAYIMRGNSKFEIRNSKLFRYWLPVDLYNGGMEHTTLHLLYSRFWHKFLFDLGLVSTLEPYQRRRSHGMVLAEDGQKMSKSRGNVINPDDIIRNYGADSLRVYEMFMGPFDQAINWSTNGLIGCFRFLSRVWGIFHNKEKSGESSKEIKAKLHQLMRKVSEDLEAMKFNTAIASFMEFVNFWSAPERRLSKEEASFFLKILAPFTPHFCEEIWQLIGYKESIFKEKWPRYDEKLIKEDTFLLIVQVNGVVRDKIEVAVGATENEVKKIALGSERVKRYLAGKEIRKFVYVPDKLVNFVV